MLERDPHIIAAFAEARAEAFMSGVVWLREYLGIPEGGFGSRGDKGLEIWLKAETEARQRFDVSRARERPSVREALVDLLQFVTECTPEGFKEGYYYSEGDELAPFFSEAFLYNLIGKMDARTLLGRFGSIAESIGYGSLWELQTELYQEKKEEVENGGNGGSTKT